MQTYAVFITISQKRELKEGLSDGNQQKTVTTPEGKTDINTLNVVFFLKFYI